MDLEILAPQEPLSQSHMPAFPAVVRLKTRHVDPEGRPGYGICPDPKRPRRDCKLMSVIGQLACEGELQRFTEVYGAPSFDGLGDCFQAAEALMLDLGSADRATGWEVVRGFGYFGGPVPFPHYWIEHDGWALDAANGKFLVIDAALYRTITRPTGIERWTYRKFLRLRHRLNKRFSSPALSSTMAAAATLTR